MKNDYNKQHHSILIPFSLSTVFIIFAQMDNIKNHIIKLLNQKGAFWSYNNSESFPSDETLMEKGLLYLEFEDMHILFELYGMKKLKKYWRENLVPQGKYYSTINWLLALYFFNIKNPDSYLKRYGKHS